MEVVTELRRMQEEISEHINPDCVGPGCTICAKLRRLVAVVSEAARLLETVQ